MLATPPGPVPDDLAIASAETESHQLEAAGGQAAPAGTIGTAFADFADTGTVQPALPDHDAFASATATVVAMLANPTSGTRRIVRRPAGHRDVRHPVVNRWFWRTPVPCGTAF